MLKNIRFFISAALLLCSLLTGWSQAVKPDFDLYLDNAVTYGAKSTNAPRTVWLDLRRNGDRWERVWGIAGSFNTSFHYGFMSNVKEEDGKLAFDLQMTIMPDSYVKSDPILQVGQAIYHVEIARGVGDSYTGTYTGTCSGATVKGTARATARPPYEIKKDEKPFVGGEHPRLLFRKSDVPALKEKLATPFGQAAKAGFEKDAIGLGILYQLTGDKTYADKAAAFVEGIIWAKEPAQINDSHHQMVQYGWNWEEVAQAYDLCYDAWTPVMRGKAESYIVCWSNRAAYQHSTMNTQMPWTVGNGEAMNVAFGMGLGSLAVAGEKGPAPLKPAEPFMGESIPPAAGYTPGKDVPVVDFDPAKPILQWLSAAAIPSLLNVDPFEKLGGFTGVRPESGTAFTVNDQPYTFAPLGADFLRPDGALVLNIGKNQRRGHVGSKPGPEWPGIADAPASFIYYTVLRIDAPRAVKVIAGFTANGKPQVYLNGRALAHGQVVKLEKGLYPVLVVARINTGWDDITVKFQDATDADVLASEEMMPSYQAEYDAKLKEWAFDTSEWQRTKGQNQEFAKLFGLFQSWIYLHCREGVGTGGIQPDHSGTSGPREYGSARYMSAYLTATGQQLSPYNDVRDFVMYKVFQRVYGDKGPGVPQSVNGSDQLDGAYFAFHWPIIRDELRPGLLWAWQREMGITKPEEAVKALNGGHPNCSKYAFVAYPLEMKAKEPKDVFPLNWAGPDHGYFGFRSGWGSKNDFLVQTYFHDITQKGYTRPDAGTFRIMGLGEVWADGLPSPRLDGQRIYDPVVQITNNDICEDANGRTLYNKFETDGSGACSVDLNDIYSDAQRNKAGNRVGLYQDYGNIRIADAFKPSGIAGMRAFGVDYSGKSGAPCLFVLVDKIDGGNEKLWLWHLASGSMSAKGSTVAGGDDPTKIAKVVGDTVTVTKPGGTMKLTSVTPTGAKLTAETRTIKFNQTYNRGIGTMQLPGIFLQGADPKEGHFFIVATIQPQGVAAPEVKVEGTGLDAVVTIGKRTVRFDGTKVIFDDVK